MGSSPKRSKRMLPNNVTAVTAFDMTQKPPKPSEHPKQVAEQQVLYNCTVNLSLLILFLQFFESPEFGDKFHKMINSWRIAAMGMQQNIFGTTWRLGLTQTFCICNLICDDFFKLTNTLGTIQTTKHTVLQQFPRRKATEREKLNKPKKQFPILQFYTFTYFRLIVHVQYTSYTYVFISSFLINLPCKIRLSQVPCLYCVSWPRWTRWSFLCGTVIGRLCVRNLETWSDWLRKKTWEQSQNWDPKVIWFQPWESNSTFWDNPNVSFVNVFKGCFESKQGPFGFCWFPPRFFTCETFPGGVHLIYTKSWCPPSWPSWPSWPSNSEESWTCRTWLRNGDRFYPLKRNKLS